MFTFHPKDILLFITTVRCSIHYLFYHPIHPSTYMKNWAHCAWGMSRIQIYLTSFQQTDPLPSLPACVQIAGTQAPGCLAADQGTGDIISSCLFSISLPGRPHVTLTQLGHAMRGPVSKACTVIVNTAITDVKIPPHFSALAVGWLQPFQRTCCITRNCQDWTRTER